MGALSGQAEDILHKPLDKTADLYYDEIMLVQKRVLHMPTYA
jgi:hypothetical protein